jgi:hypothetical protein
MKVLYIGSERREAEAIATALRGVDGEISVLWAAELDNASNWLDETRGLDALVMEAPIDGASCLVVLKQLRRLALPRAVVFIVPDGIAPTLDSLHPGAQYVRRNESLVRDLPIVVTRALERATHAELERKLAQADKLLLEQQAKYDIGMARAAASWEMVDEQLRAAAQQVEQARERERSVAADVERLSRREAELSSQLASAADAQRALEDRLADAHSAVAAANDRTEQERATAASQLADRQREFDAHLADAIDQRRGVEARLAKTVREREKAEQRHAAALEEVAQLKAREVELNEQLADAHAAVTAANDRTEQERAAAASQLADRQREFDARMANAIEQRLGVEARLADAVRERKEAEQRHAAALDDVEQVTAREVALNEQLATVTANRTELEGKLAATEAAFEDAMTRATRERLASSKKAAEREAELDGQIRRERAMRGTLEETLADADAALNEARREHLSAIADVERLTQRHTEAEAALERARQEYESAAANVERLTQRETDLASQLAETQATRLALDHQLTDASTEIRNAAAREAELAEQLDRERATRAELEQTFAETKAALDDAQQRYERSIDTSSSERYRLTLRLNEADSALEQTRDEFQAAAAEVDRLTERENDLKSQLADAQAIRETLEQTLTDTRARFVEQRQQLEVQLAHEQMEHERRSTELEERSRTLTVERDALQQSLAALQERSRQLQESLTASVEAFEVSRSENHRLFDQAGVPMFRCTRDGALADANRACTTLIGRRTLDELEGVDFAAVVFEAPQALSWLIERCVSTRAKESIETTWRRQDGSRLFMRLSARSMPSGIIEVVAEDLTRLRVLEERLGQAHRMEAIGRLASEVATTCSSLLENIQEQGREWLTTASSDADARQRGEELIEEIGRAAGFLQELAACGEEQARTPMLVDLNTLVRDLEPVLKNVVGGDVEVQLGDTSTPLNVDVGTERIERLLVNLASYGRGRIQAGGRLRIELGTSVVDRHFSAKHPNVRLGLHALITVTESRRAGREDGAQPRARRRSPQRPGVDFATLQGLVSDCGGHLWMKVQPRGEMVAKIRLPLFSQQDQRVTRTLATRGNRDRQPAHWFQS